MNSKALIAYFARTTREDQAILSSVAERIAKAHATPSPGQMTRVNRVWQSIIADANR